MIGEIYEARRLDDLSWQNINSEFQAGQLWNSSNINAITSTNFDSVILVLLIGGDFCITPLK
jgi:hypothetical protein